MSIRMRLREERAQATVEMAVVTPVLLVLALIVYNVMIFASAVARLELHDGARHVEPVFQGRLLVGDRRHRIHRRVVAFRRLAGLGGHIHDGIRFAGGIYL